MPLRRAVARSAIAVARKSAGAALLALAGAAVLAVAGVGPESWVASAHAVAGCTVDVAGTKPASVRLSQRGWVYVPLVTQTANGLVVPGVLAFQDKSQTVGQNLVTVWYENPGIAGEPWTAKSWDSQDHWEAIKWAKASFNIGDDWDFLWPTADPVSLGNASETPQPYLKGVLATDPFASYLDGPIGSELAALLADSGYQAASIPVDKDGPCDTSSVLTALAQTAVYAATNHPSTLDIEARFESLVPALVAQMAQTAPPTPVPVPVPAVPPGFIPGTTTPYPGWPVGPMPGRWQAPSAMPPQMTPGCSTATTCCYTQPIIFLYYTTNWLGLTVTRYCVSSISWSCPAPPGVPPAPCPTAPPCPAPPGPYLPPPGPLPAGACDHDYDV